MAGRMVAVIAIWVGLVGSLLVPAGLTQTEGSTGSSVESPGYLYLTDEVFGTNAFPQPCQGTEEVPIFRITAEVPRDSEIGPAYVGGQYGPLACGLSFTYEVRKGFILGPGTKVTFWVGCDRPDARYSTSDVEQFSDYRVILSHNGQQVAEHDGDYAFPLEVTGFCFPDQLTRFEAPLDPPETVAAPGDTLTLQFALFGALGPDNPYYIATGSEQSPSSFYGPGFPGMLRASPQSDLLVSAGNSSGSTGPGNATTYPFTIENTGEEPRTVSLSVDGPDAWAAEPTPASPTLPPGESVRLNLTVGAPGTLANGAEAQHLVTVASGEEEVTFVTTTTVQPGEGRAAPELLGISSTPEGSASGLRAFIDDFGVELAATGVAGLAAFLGRRFLF